MRPHALAAAVVAALAVLVPSAAGRVANSVTFNDPAGTDPNTPDLTALTISDSPSGQLQFAFTLQNMPSQRGGLFVFVDADRNATTGSDGSDYELEMTVESNGDRHWDVTRWDATARDWVSMPETATMGVTRSDTTWTIRVGKADLGGTTGFTFWVVAARFTSDDHVAAADRLPDGGTLVYELSPPAPPVVVPAIGKPVLTPAAPTAGKRLKVSFPVTDSATGAPLTSGTMTCDPQVAGKVIAHVESFGDGRATLTFVVPKNAKGKVLTVRLGFRVGAKVARTAASFRVR